MISLLKRSQTAGLALVGLLIFTAACSHQSVRQVGSHKVTVSRHGYQKQFQADAERATLEYTGVSTDGKRLKVSISGDRVKVNGRDGMLRPGDSVFIGDDGLAVNSLDYGESEKYLQANVAASATASN